MCGGRRNLRAGSLEISRFDLDRPAARATSATYIAHAFGPRLDKPEPPLSPPFTQPGGTAPSPRRSPS
eukprot:773895-Prymnesium_polylepis.1